MRSGVAQSKKRTSYPTAQTIDTIFVPIGTDIRHISGKASIVTYTLSPISEIHAPLTPANFAREQNNDPKFMRAVKERTSSLSYTPIFILDNNLPLFCDVRDDTPQKRIIVPTALHLQTFQQIHGLVHCRARATFRSMHQAYIWPRMAQNVRAWTRSCTACARKER